MNRELSKEKLVDFYLKVAENYDNGCERTTAADALEAIAKCRELLQKPKNPISFTQQYVEVNDLL